MAGATPLAQRAFWAAANRRARRIESVGQVASAILGSREFRQRMQLGPLRELWSRVVPANLAAHTDVVSCRGGRLTVAVDSAAVRFALERELRPALLRSLQSSPAGRGIREIVFELSGQPGAADAWDRVRSSRRGKS